MGKMTKEQRRQKTAGRGLYENAEQAGGSGYGTKPSSYKPVSHM